MAVQKQDIDLLFGVKGGGSISGESGTLIQSQLANIMKSLNSQNGAKDRRITIGLDVAGTKKNFTQGLRQITDGLSGQKQFSIKLDVAEINAKSAIDKVRQELQTMLDTLSVNASGMTISVPTAAGEISASASATQAIREEGNAAELAAQKTAVYKVQLEALNKVRNQANAAVKNAEKNAKTDEERVSVAGLKTEYEQLAVRVEEFKAKKEKGFRSSVDIETERQEIEAYGVQVLENAKNFKKSADAVNDYAAQISKLTSLQKAAKTALGYTKAKGTAQYATIETISKELDAMANGYAELDKTKLNTLANTLKTNTAQIRSMGMASRSLGDIVTANAKKFTSWLGVSQMVMRGVQALRKMVQAVKDVDVAMTELRKVTEETESTYARFLDNTAKRTKVLGATLADTINATADFARLGYGLEDAAQLAETAIVYKNVGDGIKDISDASASIISTMQAFGVAAEDSMKIVDKFNAVGNNFAISSKGVGDALLRSASAMRAANNTLDETIALVTAANTVVQDADKVGTTMKTLSMFLRAAKTEAEEAGENTEGMANSVSELRDELLALTGDKVDIQINEDTFKSTYQILKEMSAVWGEITDVSQANILELIGGKRNSNVVAAILNNFDIAERVLQTSANSAGSALEENEKYLDSIAGKTAILKATFEDFSNTFIGSDVVKAVVDLSNAMLGFVNQLAKMKVLLPIIAVAVNTIISLKRMDAVRSMAAEVASITTKLIAEKAANEALVPSYAALNKKQQERILQNLQEAVTLEKLTKDEYDSIAAALSASGAAAGAAASVGGLGAGIKALFASNWVGWVITAITLLPTLIGLFDSLGRREEEEQQKAVQAAEEYKEMVSAIDGYKQRVIDLKKSLADGNLSQEEAYNVRKELLSIQEDVRKAYGEEAAAIDLVRTSADGAVKSLDNLTTEFAKENLVKQDKQIKRAIENIENPQKWLGLRLFDESMGSAYADDDVLTRIKGVVEKYKDVIAEEWVTGNFISSPAFAISFSSTAEDAKETITNLATDFKNLKEQLLEEGKSLSGTFLKDDDFLSAFTGASDAVDEVIEKYRALYEQQVQWKIATVDSYAEAMDVIGGANGAFMEAVAADDVDALEAAIEAINNLSIDPEKINDNGVRNYMQQLISDMQEEALKYTVNIKLSANVEEDEWTGRVKSALATLAGENGVVTATDINNAGITAQAEREAGFARGGSETQAWQALSDAAGEYGLTVDGLIPILEKYGYIAVSTAEDAKHALSNLKDTLSQLKTAYDTLTKAMEEMAGDGGLSTDTVQNIVNELAESGENYTDYLYEENGLIKLNTKAWEERALVAGKSDIQRLREEIESLEEERKTLSDDSAVAALDLQIGKLQEQLGLLERIYDSLAVGPWQEVFNEFDAHASAMQKLADIQAELDNGYTISAQKAREFAEVYPEILEQAESTSTGEIQLNEAVVNAFIEGKQAELNANVQAEIEKLEAKRAVLHAQLEIINQQIAAAESGDEAEVQSATEAAGAKEAVFQAVLTAAEQAGIDEKTANQLALAAMTEDWGTFEKLAEEAVYNLDDESATVFTNVMTNFANMAKNIVGNANEVTNAYSNMGTALENAMKGLTTGEYKANIKFGSVSGIGRESVNSLLREMFDAGKSDYGNGGSQFETRAEEWQAALQGIADNYARAGSNLDALNKEREKLQGQIVSVDSQIELLRGLSQTSLKMFRSGESKSGSSSSGTKEVEEYIADIEKYREAIERLNRVRIDKELAETTLSNTDDLEARISLENRIIELYRDEQDAMHSLNELRRETLAQGTKQLEELGFQVDFDPENNKFFVRNLEHINELTATTRGEYGSLKEATNALRKDTETFIDTLVELNEANQENSSTWWDLKYSIHDAQVEIINDLKEIVVQASDAVDEIQKVYDTLKSAADEYAENGGFISVDAFQSIVELGPEYMQYLRDENGLLVINEENINKVIAAKTQQLALENALSYVERLRLALENDSIEDLNTLLFATTENTNATWGLVYANLALLDLNGDQYEAALHNINAIRSLADSAIQGIGQTAVSTTDTLNEMKDGLDDILKYVMAMLKQRIQNQIDALEEMKDAFAEIIELKKESLDATKDEEDYQEAVADKIKEIAKLQAQIDALSLDNSRDAQAKRANLLEQMNDLQAELADQQSEYAVEKQKESLDKMQEDYEEEKDHEIDILEESISSYQKLYDMAIEYIRTHWDTLLNELLEWNTEYGDVLNSEIVTAWENALAAAQRYGSYVSALNNIQGDIDAANRSGGASNNVVVGQSGKYSDDYTSGYSAKVSDIVEQMRKLSQQWRDTSNKSVQEDLHEKSVKLAEQLPRLGVTARFDSGNGVWWIADDRLNPQFIGKQLLACYHTGGIAGDAGTLKENELLAKIQRGEVIVSNRDKASLFSLIDFVSTLKKAFDMSDAPKITGPEIPDQRRLAESITNNKGPRIDFGDVYIYGANEDTVEKHREVNRQFVNEVLEKLKIRK